MACVTSCHKITSKEEGSNEKWERKPAAKYYTAVERPILKLGLSNFRWSFYFTLLLVAPILFRRVFRTSHMTLSIASIELKRSIAFLNKNTYICIINRNECQVSAILRKPQIFSPTPNPFWKFMLYNFLWLNSIFEKFYVGFIFYLPLLNCTNYLKSPDF